MPWQTLTLEQLRTLNRDNVQSQLRSGPMIPNSGLRVMSDANAGLAYLTLLYLNWLALQVMPDTAEREWLDRFANIWLRQGRKSASFASATITFTSIGSVVMPAEVTMSGATDNTTGASLQFQTQSPFTIGTTPTAVSVLATSPGQTGLVVGSTLSLDVGIAGINGVGTITAIRDGIEEETDDELRARLLDRIRQPPVGGDAEDYVQWATATPGVNVTRAWCSPLEMGPGTVTIRFMTDTTDTQGNKVAGFANAADIQTVTNYTDTVRPVAIKDRFVTTCVPEPINFTITGLSPDTVANRNAIAASVNSMLFERAAPAHAINGIEQSAQAIYRAWVSEAISSVSTIDSFTLIMDDHPMPYPGSLGVLGTIVYG
jgi:uncharacterized phage protein gp47/JayE